MVRIFNFVGTRWSACLLAVLVELEVLCPAAFHHQNRKREE